MYLNKQMYTKNVHCVWRKIDMCWKRPSETEERIKENQAKTKTKTEENRSRTAAKQRKQRKPKKARAKQWKLMYRRKIKETEKPEENHYKTGKNNANEATVLGRPSTVVRGQTLHLRGETRVKTEKKNQREKERKKNQWKPRKKRRRSAKNNENRKTEKTSEETKKKRGGWRISGPN